MDLLVLIITSFFIDGGVCYQVCEFAIGVTAGENSQDVVPIAVRQPLLQIWVTAKQMAQQQISKMLGTDDDVS